MTLYKSPEEAQNIHKTFELLSRQLLLQLAVSIQKTYRRLSTLPSFVLKAQHELNWSTNFFPELNIVCSILLRINRWVTFPACVLKKWFYSGVFSFNKSKSQQYAKGK